MAVRVVVVDDEPMVCAHLRTILGAAGDLEVVDEAHDGAAAIEAVKRSRPDVVLMDLRMPGVDGLLSEATIKGYVSRMLDKLGCANRTQAGLLAHDAGIVGR